MSEVRCWACQKMGHYAATCSKRKNKGKKGIAASIEVDNLLHSLTTILHLLLLHLLGVHHLMCGT